MTLNIRIERDYGSEVVWEQDQEPLGLIKSLTLDMGHRGALVATGPGFEDTAARTAETLVRHGFEVDLDDSYTLHGEYRALSPDLAMAAMCEHARHRPVMTVVDNGPMNVTWLVRWEER